MPQPKPYNGPFDPPPAESLVGAIGWRHVSKHNGDGTWSPDGWQVVYPDGILTLDKNGMGVVDSILHAV